LTVTRARLGSSEKIPRIRCAIRASELAADPVSMVGPAAEGVAAGFGAEGSIWAARGPGAKAKASAAKAMVAIRRVFMAYEAK